MCDRNEKLLQVILVERHLVDVTKDAPVYEMTHEASKSGDAIALDLIKSHEDVLLSDLVSRIVECLTEMAG